MKRLTALVLIVGATACGGSEASDSPDPTPAPTTVAVQATDTTNPAAPSSTTTTTTASTAPMTSAPETSPPTSPPPTTSPPVSAPSIRSIIDSGAILNLAHAGGDQAAPHSTRFAFAEAVRAGATALEMDVQLTADGVLIVQHDDTVDKTTEATGPVAGLTLDEIQALDNAFWFSPNCWPCQDRPLDEYVYRGVRAGVVPPPDGYGPDDFRVPTFREIATAFPAMPLDIEIKGDTTAALLAAEQLAVELIELDRVSSVVVVSFDDAVVDAFHELAPDVAVSPGLARLTDWFLNGTELAPHFEVLQLPPFQGDIEVVNAEVVARIHEEGRIVWVWPDDASTQENTAFYETLIGYGVDGVIAGRPAEMSLASAG